MHLQPKERLRFFLDYGECLWGDGGVCWPYEELLSPQTCVEVERFVCEFDAYYGYGLLPYEDFMVEDCRRFNRESRRVFALILADIKDTCIICNCSRNSLKMKRFWKRGAKVEATSLSGGARATTGYGRTKIETVKARCLPSRQLAFCVWGELNFSVRCLTLSLIYVR